MIWASEVIWHYCMSLIIKVKKSLHPNTQHAVDHFLILIFIDSTVYRFLLDSLTLANFFIYKSLPTLYTFFSVNRFLDICFSDNSRFLIHFLSNYSFDVLSAFTYRINFRHSE